MRTSMILHTNGSGYWSPERRTVKHNRMEARVIVDQCYPNGEERIFGELKVYFAQRDWNPNKHGLIYTDKLWMQEFRKHLRSIGFSEAAVRDVSYSEQGMQGDNYVSLDIGDKFISEYVIAFNGKHTVTEWN